MKRRALSLKDDVAEIIDRIARSRSHVPPGEGPPPAEGELVLPEEAPRIRARRPEPDAPSRAGGWVAAGGRVTKSHGA